MNKEENLTVAALRETGITQRAMGFLLGVTPHTICQWANGKREPKGPAALFLGLMAGINPDEWGPALELAIEVAAAEHPDRRTKKAAQVAEVETGEASCV